MKQVLLFSILLISISTYSQEDSLTIDSTKFNTKLRSQILTMFEFDQQLRIEWGELEKEFGDSSAQVDSIKTLVDQYRKIHRDKLDSLINLNGFPTHKTIGKDGVQGLFVMVAHAKDLDFQELCLIYFVIEAKEGGLSWQELAILFDKIQVEKGQPQYFSTQPLETDDGSFKLYPIADEKNLDQRRVAFDMLPIKEFLDQFGVKYVPTSDF